MKCPLLIALITLTCLVNGQIKRTQNWYFGDSAGLSFATNPPKVLSDGAMHAIEGCATMSDTSGNLLFYTNGVTVWNKNHKVMDNGTGLFGRETSTQSSIIIPQPGNDSLYFIFTTDGAGLFQKGFQYTTVNIHENGGLGKVISKNKVLVDLVCEKLTATHHANGKDIWVLVHGFPNDSFYAYLITEHGLINCPVISKTGSVHGIPNQLGEITRFDAQGAMKFNIKSNLLAASVFGLNKIEVFGFDNSSGGLSYKASAKGILLPYGIEFSPNSAFLYCTDKGFNLLQFNLAYWQSDSITMSKKTLASASNEIFNQLQLASNGTIYVSKNPSPAYPFDTLGQIMNPNLEYPNCLYIDPAASLQKKALLGLPNFVSSYFYNPNLNFQYKANCDNDSIRFEAKSSYTTGTIAWEILKNASIIHSTSQSTFSISLKDTGNYVVRLMINGDTVSKTIYKEPSLNLGTDTTICNQKSIELTIPDNFRCLNWQDGSDSQSYSITQAGTYSVSGYNYTGCLLSDTIQVKFGTIQKPLISRTGDSLSTKKGSFTYQWSFNETPIGTNNSSLVIKQTGDYKVQITDSLGCSSLSDVFPVNTLSLTTVQTSNIQVFPNPSDREKGIWIQSIWPIENIKMYSINGQLILDEKPETSTFQIKPNQPGIYFLTVNRSKHFRVVVR